MAIANLEELSKSEPLAQLSGLKTDYTPETPTPERMGFWEAAAGQQTQNLIPKAWDWLKREKPPEDVSWENPVLNDPEVPDEFVSNFAAASSQEEYDQIKARIKEELEWNRRVSNASGLGKAGAILSGLLDPALILAAPAEEIAVGSKILQIGRLSAMLRGGAVLGASAVLSEAALVGVSETKPWEDVYGAAAGGFILGGGLGSFKWGRNVLAGSKNQAEHQIKMMELAHERAALSTGAEGYLPQINSPEWKDAIINGAESAAHEEKPGIFRRVWNMSMGDWVSKFSPSVTARETMKRLAETSVENVGDVRHTTAAVEREVTHRSLASTFSDGHALLMDWAKRNGMGFSDTILRGETAEKFGRAIIEELENLRMTGAFSPDIDPAVKKMAEIQGTFYKKELGFAKAAGVEGAEKVAEDPSYWHRAWNFAKMAKDKADFVPLLGKALRGMSDKLTEKESEAIAGRVFSKMRDKFTQHADARMAYRGERQMDAMIEAIGETVSNPDEIDHLIAKLVPNTPERAPRFFRSKMDLDFSVTHNGKSLLDYVDTNVMQMMADRAAHSSGRIAMAKQGIKSDAEWDNLISQIRREAAINPAKKDRIEKDIQKLEVVRRQLLGQPTYDISKNKTRNAILRDLMDLTHLGMMGQMGVAQATELATLFGENGLTNVIRAMPQMKALKKAMSKDPELAKDFACLAHFVAEDHKFMLPNLRTDEGRLLRSEDGAVLTGFRNGLQEGKRLMGYLSLQNQVLSAERKLWEHSTYIRFWEHANHPKRMAIPEKRLADMGISPEFNNRITDNIRKYGKDTDGVKSLGLHKWPEEDLHAFQMVMGRQMNTAIQGNLAGEVPMWATTSFGRVLAQFRNFPLVAFTKQTKRMMQYHDTQALKTLAYSALIGTAVHYGRAELNYAGNNSPKARERYERAHSPQGVASGMFRYLPAASMLPDIGGVTANLLGMNLGMAAYRGVPTAKADLDLGDLAASGSYLTNAVQGLVAAPVKAVTGKKLTGRDARAIISLMPFNNILGVNQVSNVVADQFTY